MASSGRETEEQKTNSTTRTTKKDERQVSQESIGSLERQIRKLFPSVHPSVRLFGNIEIPGRDGPDGRYGQGGQGGGSR